MAFRHTLLFFIFKPNINRREIVSTESGPRYLILSPNPGGEGRVRGCSRQYKYAILNISWAASIPGFVGAASSRDGISTSRQMVILRT
jgi:hypothetical protein